MAIKCETKGSGITEKRIVRASGEHLAPAVNGFAKNWNDLIKRGGDVFGAMTIELVEACREIVGEEAPENVDEDSELDFALRILRQHDLAQAEKERGNVAGAMRCAFNMGIDAAQLELKHWTDVENRFLAGRKIKQSTSAGGVTTSRQLQPLRSLVLSEMAALIDQGHTIANAARLVAAKGIGKSKGANERRWHRHRK